MDFEAFGVLVGLLGEVEVERRVEAARHVGDHGDLFRRERPDAVGGHPDQGVVAR